MCFCFFLSFHKFSFASWCVCASVCLRVLYQWVRLGFSPPARWSQSRCSSSFSQRWGLPSQAPPPQQPSASSGPSAWRPTGWELWWRLQWRAEVEVAWRCSRRRRCPPPWRSLAPAWACAECRDFGRTWELREPPSGTRGTRAGSSAWPASGSRRPAAAASGGTPAAFASAPWEVLRPILSGPESRLVLCWVLRARRGEEQGENILSNEHRMLLQVQINGITKSIRNANYW